MDNLPPEILREILLHVPTSSLPECRLVCRSFSTIAFPMLFSFIPKWLDYGASHRAIVMLAHNSFDRPAVMWSPWASHPDEPVDVAWMNLVWKVLMHSDPPNSSIAASGVADQEGASPDSRENGGAQLNSANFAELSGREEMTESKLRISQNRFLLHRKYASKVVNGF
ncbi:hypothetical protein D0Z07_9292 [Hyphodiscus hymeniophilus]|uniref:F-box domain-containing protein n=1 Tax=Hyphodiscus hymeniophilus TaxID=353542 RepID=A0A9P6SL33_9HELO|nr:hypothetical protein D0Z07_9292 [Hyphodiscus hymeniophilus]